MQFLSEREYPLVNRVDGFSLVGTEKSHYWCGIWQTYGCLHHKTAYIRQFKKTCFRPQCKTCYISWALRQSKRTLHKLNSNKNNNTLKHMIVTQTDSWSKDSRKQLIQTLKNNGVEFACLIFTPFDESNNGKFFLKNTIHVFYYGVLSPKTYSLLAIQFYPQNDLDGTNQTLLKSLQIQYLNCGIKQGVLPVSWIGKSLYCKIEIKHTKQNGKNCPICNRKLKLIYYTGEKDPIPPDEYFDGELEKDGWKYCHTDSFLLRLFKKIKRIAHKLQNEIHTICHKNLIFLN